jgi:hypothetical protein
MRESKTQNEKRTCFASPSQQSPTPIYAPTLPPPLPKPLLLFKIFNLSLEFLYISIGARREGVLGVERIRASGSCLAPWSNNP